MLNKIFWSLFLLASVALGFFIAGYLGAWCCWVGSVTDLIKQAKLDEPESGRIALDLFCFFIGASVCIAVGFWIGSFGVALSSYHLFKESRERRQREAQERFEAIQQQFTQTFASSKKN